MISEEQFFDHQPLAIFGVSSQGKGFGASAYRELTRVGVKCQPVNPKGGMVQGQPIFSSLKDLPEPARAAVILTRGEGALRAVRECSRHNLEWVWLQGGSDTGEVRRLCAELGLKTMQGHCILLRKGRFPHSLHRFFYDLFSGKKSISTQSTGSGKEG